MTPPLSLGVLASAYVAPAGGGDPLADFSWVWRFEADSITGVSDGATVATWPDTSGYSRNATQSTPANRPTFDADAFGTTPGVMFTNGSDQRLVTSGLTAMSQPSTMYVVGSGAGAGDRVAVDGLTGYRHMLGSDSATPTTAEVYAGGSSGYATGMAMTSPGIWVIRFNTTSSSIWASGGAATALSLGTGQLTGLTLGNRYTSTKGYGGRLGAVLLANSSHTLPTINAVGTYLANKFGLTWTEAT